MLKESNNIPSNDRSHKNEIAEKSFSQKIQVKIIVKTRYNRNL